MPNDLLQQVDAAGAGDEQALACLIAHQMPAIRAAAAQSVCPGLDFDDAVQEGILGLLRAIKTYDPAKGAGFTTYADVCIRNAAADAAKRARRKKHAPLNQSVPLPEEQPAPGPEELVLQSEQDASAFETLSQRLSVLERRVLALFLEGQPYSAIAAQLGIPEKSVDNALQRVRAKLR